MNRRRGPRGNQLSIQDASIDEAGIVKLVSKDDINEPSKKVVTAAALTAWEGYPHATIEKDGVLKIATPEDVVEGVKDDCVVTPKALANWAHAQVATPEEVLLGENDVKPVTPRTLNMFFGGKPNLLLATDFEFNPMQLGTVVNAPKNGLLADRVMHDFSGILETTSEIVDVAPTVLAGKEVTKALKVSFQGGKTVTYWKLKLPIKGVRGGKHTLSMAIKGSDNVEIIPTVNQWFNASDGGDNAILNIGFSNPLKVDTTMQVLTATVDLPSIEGKKVGKDNHIMIELAISMPPTQMSLIIPFIKFEEGDIATNMPETNKFETRQECMQYQQIIRSAMGYYSLSSKVFLTRSLHIPLYSEPTLTRSHDGGMIVSCAVTDTVDSGEPILMAFSEDGLHFSLPVRNVKTSGSACIMHSEVAFIQARCELSED